MEQERPRPPAYVSHHPADLNLPSVPRTELSQPHVQAEITLPDLKTVLSPDFQQTSERPETPAHDHADPARSLPRIDPGHANRNAKRTSTDTAVMSPSETGSAMSTKERGARSTSAVSMDDPDVRLAAEALSGLGNPGMISSSLPKRKFRADVGAQTSHALLPTKHFRTQVRAAHVHPRSRSRSCSCSRKRIRGSEAR